VLLHLQWQISKGLPTMKSKESYRHLRFGAKRGFE
jgi:hypothetical protein